METMQPQQATVQTETIIRGQGTKTATRIKDQQETKTATTQTAVRTNKTTTTRPANQNSGSQGVNNNNPAPTNPTGNYHAVNCQFNVHMPQDGGQVSGTIVATVDCSVQQSGNSTQLALTLTPTSVSSSLSQSVGSSPVTFNFAGTASGSTIIANAKGNTGPDGNQTIDFNLSGTLTSSALTFTINSASDSQLSVSTQQSITLQVSQ
jgi:hypothetical protein